MATISEVMVPLMLICKGQRDNEGAKGLMFRLSANTGFMEVIDIETLLC